MPQRDDLRSVVVIEPAREDDTPAIKALAAEGHINPTSLDWRNFLVARHPTEGVIGCVQAMDSPLSSRREVKSLVVRKDFRGRGLAPDLIRAIAARETEPLWGTCVETLVPYYLRFGCRVPEAHETPTYYRLIKVVSAAFHALSFGRTPRVAVLTIDPRDLAG